LRRLGGKGSAAAVTFLACVMAVGAMTGGCHGRSRMPTVAIVNGPAGRIDDLVEGFKEVLADAGFREGETVRYLERVYSGQEAESLFRDLVRAKVDLVANMSAAGTTASLPVIKPSGIPMVFIVADAVGTGVVEDRVRHGNLTGIQVLGYGGAAISMFREAVPNLRKVYVVYNPQDPASIVNFQDTAAMAAQIGVELLVVEARTHQQIRDALADIPDEADGLYSVPAAYYIPLVGEYSQAAISRGLPYMATTRTEGTASPLFTFGISTSLMGRQLGRIAEKILHGTSASALPVETVESYFAVNLATARRMGFYVRDEILDRANAVNR